MIAGISKVFAYKASEVTLILPGCILLSPGAVKTELTISGGSFTAKSGKNPILKPYELVVDSPISLSESTSFKLLHAPHVFVVATKNGEWLALGSKFSQNKISIKQDTGESSGDQVGDKITVEGEFYTPIAAIVG